MATKTAKETGGLLTIDGKDFQLTNAVEYGFGERMGGGNNLDAYPSGGFVLADASDDEYKGLATLFAKRKYVDGKLATNEVGGTGADKVTKLENLRITGLTRYGRQVDVRIEVGKITDWTGTLVAVQDWNDAVKK